MPHSAKATQLQEPKTLLWLEQEILAQTPQVGILDGASLGYLSVAEHVGKLAGAWRNHRILLHDLDTEAVTTSLGELLGAVVQMAHAVGVSLETVAEGQVQRMRTSPMRIKQQKAPVKPISKAAPPASAPAQDATATPHRKKASHPQSAATIAAARRGRADATSRVGSASASPSPLLSPSSAPRSPRKTRSPGPPPSSAPATNADAMSPSPHDAKRQRRRSAPVPVQQTLLGGEPAPKRRRQPATPSRRAGVS